MTKPQGMLLVDMRRKAYLPVSAQVTVAHVAELGGSKSLVQEASRIVLGNAPSKEGKLSVISAAEVSTKVSEALPDAHVDIHGETETLLIATSEKSSAPGEKPSSILGLALACLLLFVGSATALMNFHADVNMPEVHSRVHEILTGERASRSLWIQVPYSLGIGIGSLAFFGLLSPRRKGRAEPGPLEVEMFLYEENMDRCLAGMTKDAKPGG